MIKIEWEDTIVGFDNYDSIFGQVDDQEAYVLRKKGEDWNALHIGIRGDESLLGSGTLQYAKHLCQDHLNGNIKVHRWLPVTDGVKPPYDIPLLVTVNEFGGSVHACEGVEGVGFVCPGGLVIPESKVTWFMPRPAHPKH